jgi:RHS repeat-associated protein
VVLSFGGTWNIVGNLVFDGVYWYQYDGWNRLVQVNEAGSLTEDDFDTSGFLIPPDPNDPNDPNGVVGDPVARFVYDGLGRLAFYSTHLNHSTPLDGHVNQHLYYDGVRRVSEHRHTRLWGYPVVDTWDERDYVWGPDYVDELAFVIHAEGGVRYAIQDANYNLVGLMKAGSAVAAQYVYGPYGELRAADLRPTEPEWPAMGVGHQGLFFIRFDGEPDDPPLAVGAQGLYYNRNRWYSPHLGRFIQRDVNETALPILEAYAFNGLTAESLLGAFDGRGLYGDGMNLYAYLDSNPVNYGDPAGLFAFGGLGDLLGSTLVRKSLFALEAGSYTAMGLDFHTALQSGVGWRNAMIDLVIGVAADRLGGKAFDLALDAAARGFAAMRRAVSRGGAGELGAEAVARGYRPRGVCFVAGTPITLADGSTEAIECLEVDDQVLTRPEDSPDSQPYCGRITRAFRRLAAGVLWITLASGEVLGTTEEHVVWADQRGWVAAGQLKLGDALLTVDGAQVEITKLMLDPTPTEVYNLEVGNMHTYYASGVWVHNGGCRSLVDLLPVGTQWRRTFNTSKGRLRSTAWIAENTGEGGRLFLQDVALFPEGGGDLTNQLGITEVRRMIREVKDWARNLGFSELEVSGVRISGANIGFIPDRVFKL